jgi:hypothetical protein
MVARHDLDERVGPAERDVDTGDVRGLDGVEELVIVLRTAWREDARLARVPLHHAGRRRHGLRGEVDAERDHDAGRDPDGRDR